jgi:hypothetical protein
LLRSITGLLAQLVGKEHKLQARIAKNGVKFIRNFLDWTFFNAKSATGASFVVYIFAF